MTRRFALLVLVALPVTCPAQTLICGRADQPPAIDASAGDSCWADAMLAADFSVLGSGGEDRALRQTTCRAAWDSDALYLHFTCLEDQPETITANVADRDGANWMEDCVEVFLQPDTNKSDYVHLIANARGTLYDEINADAGFNADVRLKAAVGESAWTVEMAVPWSELKLNPPKTSDRFGFNVVRVHRPKQPTEWTTWAKLDKGARTFGTPDSFGRLEFAGAPAPGRASGLSVSGALIKNANFAQNDGAKPANWALRKHSKFGEIAPMGGAWSVSNDGDYSVASQGVDIPVEPGDIFTIFAVIRGSADTTAGIAAVQEMSDGRPDDLYPFWGLQVTPEYRLYTGRILVDEGAERIKSFILYRSNKRGRVEFAYAQMVRGVRGVSGIADAGKCTRRDERGLGDPWPTPAVPSFKPLPGGPLKALVFVGEFQRDAVELAQRLDMDYDLVYCPTYRGSGKVEQVVAFEPERISKTLTRGEYDLIILGGRPSEQSVIDGILSCVKSGTGLVAVEPLAGGAAGKPEILEQLLRELPTDKAGPEQVAEVLGALSPRAISDSSAGKQILKSLRVGGMDKGRIARLTWSESVPGLVPFAGGTGEYWEYRWAALAKVALWSSRRLPEARISGLTCDHNLSIAVSAPQPEPLDIEVSYDDALSGVTTWKMTTGAITEGTATVQFAAPPALETGARIARVLLRDASGNALDFAAATVPAIPSPVTIGKVDCPGQAVPGGTVDVTVTCASRQAPGAELRAEIVDAFDRTISRAAKAIADGEQTVRLSLAVREPLSVYHRVVVSAVRPGAHGDTILDRAEKELFVPAANASHLDDFAMAVGYAAMHVRCPRYLQDHLVGFLRDRGVRACTVNEYMIRRGMPAFGGVSGAGMRHSDPSNTRKRCFSDPAEIAGTAKRVTQRIAGKRKWGFFGYNMDDETHLHQQASVEVRNGPHCTKAFAEWARGEYKTVEATNAQWGTEYGGFGEIKAPLLADMKGAQNPSRWVDFRLFMERVWANNYAQTHRAVREKFPEVNLSFTNPYKYNSLSGTDFSLWVPHEEMLLRYFHRHVVDRNRSWTDAPMVSWFGYRNTAPQAGRFVWWFAFNGGVVPIWWDPIEPWAYGGKDGFTPWYMFGPLWRETGRSQAVTRSTMDLQTGIGKVLREAKAPAPEALIVHSQASMHTVYAEAALPVGRPTEEGYNRYRSSDEAIAQALKRRGMTYAYVLPEKIAARCAGVKLIALPSCVSLADDAVSALEKFAADGGLLLADVLPGTRDAHGKMREASALAGVFEGANAKALGDFADASDAGDLDALMTSLGVQPDLKWARADGASPQHTEMYRYALGPTEYIGLVRSDDPESKEDGAIALRLQARRFAYDCRTGEFLGETDALSLDVPVADARFIALLPYKPTGMELSCEIKGQTLSIEASLADVKTPADHVFRVEVTRPGEDAPSLCYSRNVRADGGKLAQAIPLALNDPAGQWRVSVRDVATGLSATAEATW